MKGKELTVVGISLLLLGIILLVYGHSIPMPVYAKCQTGAPQLPVPACGSPSVFATIVYFLGGLAIAVGIGMLVAKVWPKKKIAIQV